MDPQTVQAYNDNAQAYAKYCHEQAAPEEMYHLLRHYFRSGKTVDIGCGSGRNTAWLAERGHTVCGYDATERLLNQAIARYPTLLFKKAALPELRLVPRGAFDNVLCDRTIMHLDTDMIARAMHSLMSLLRKGGTLYLSWRVAEGESRRDAIGKLYTAFDKRLVLDQCAPEDEVLLDWEGISMRSGNRIHRLIVRKAD